MTRVTLICPTCRHTARRDLSNEVACRGTHETSSDPALCPHGHGLMKRKDGVQQERWALWSRTGGWRLAGMAVAKVMKRLEPIRRRR